ncbi:hypothetical protein TNCV_4243621 [Trichonephila clavipes]|nr:hypothetical protein TNCV_4243621 [Trichonephila clavipes]
MRDPSHRWLDETRAARAESSIPRMAVADPSKGGQRIRTSVTLFNGLERRRTTAAAFGLVILKGDRMRPVGHALDSPGVKENKNVHRNVKVSSTYQHRIASFCVAAAFSLDPLTLESGSTEAIEESAKPEITLVNQKYPSV